MFSFFELLMLGLVLWVFVRVVEALMLAPPGHGFAGRPAARNVRSTAWGQPQFSWVLPVGIALMVLLFSGRGRGMPMWSMLVVFAGFWMAQRWAWPSGRHHVDADPAAAHEEHSAATAQAARNPELAETLLHSPKPTRYPESGEGIAWGFFRAVGMIVLFVTGAAFLLISSTELQPGEIASQTAKMVMDRRASSEKKLAPLVFARAETTTVEGDLKEVVAVEAPSDGTTFQPEDLLTFPGDDGRRFTFYSRVHSQIADADLEVLNRISQFLTLALESTTSVAAEDWSPGVNWVAHDMVSGRLVQKQTSPMVPMRQPLSSNTAQSADVNKKPDADSTSASATSDSIAQSLLLSQQNSTAEKAGPTTTMYRVRMDVDLSPERLDKLYKQFTDDRSTTRTIMLAKIYAGAVMMLGGVAIFMRLGTGRRPSLPLVKT